MSNNGVAVNTQLLRLARLRKGWSLRDVADRTEQLGKRVDHGNIARYEHGQIRPNPRALALVAEALDLTVDELIEGVAA